jgi:hypothetical protein
MSSIAWTDAFTMSLQNAWATIMGFLPTLIGAIIVLIVGLIIASVIRSIFEKIVDALKIDAILKKVGFEKFIERAGMQLSSGKFIGGLAYWFLVIVIVLAISDVLGFVGLSSFLTAVLAYFPSVVVAALIMLASLVVANFLRVIVRGSVMSAKLHASRFLGTLVWWSIVIFGFLTALLQLGVATQLIYSIIIGFIAMLSLAGGIAFGLGGKDYAEHLLGKLRDHTENR